MESLLVRSPACFELKNKDKPHYNPGEEMLFRHLSEVLLRIISSLTRGMSAFQ
jgi:hypothetical protein